VYFIYTLSNLKFFNIYSSNIKYFKYNYKLLKVGGAYENR